MEITIQPAEYLINVPRKHENGEMIESNFMIKAFKINNNSEQTVSIVRFTFELNAKGRTCQTIIYSEQELQDRITSFSKKAERLLTEREGLGEIFRRGNMKKLIGTDELWNNKHFSISNTLDPGQETGYLYEHFRINAKNPVDELVISVYFMHYERGDHVQLTIPVREYVNKNKYIFPARGTWCALCTWDDPISGHRDAWSQEFAIDLVQLDSNMKVEIQNKPNELSACYGKEAIAIAEGEVVECHDQYPENPTAGVLSTREQIIKLAHEHGFNPVGAGNYIILKHENEEYSFYAHFIPGSLQVKKGDGVKQGQALGKMGNSGNSEGPHLHFQLMDGPSFLTGRGLPCEFTNIKNIFGEPVKIIDQSNAIIHVSS